jgi:hypothetical protein
MTAQHHSIPCYCIAWPTSAQPPAAAGAHSPYVYPHLPYCTLHPHRTSLLLTPCGFEQGQQTVALLCVSREAQPPMLQNSHCQALSMCHRGTFLRTAHLGDAQSPTAKRHTISYCKTVGPAKLALREPILLSRAHPAPYAPSTHLQLHQVPSTPTTPAAANCTPNTLAHLHTPHVHLATNPPTSRTGRHSEGKPLLRPITTTNQSINVTPVAMKQQPTHRILPAHLLTYPTCTTVATPGNPPPHPCMHTDLHFVPPPVKTRSPLRGQTVA